MNGNCYYSEGINPTVTCNKNEGNRIAIPVLTPDRAVKHQKQIAAPVCIEDFYESRPAREYEDETPTLRRERTGLKVAIPVLTPDRAVKHQNGRRMKEDGDPSYTVTAQEPQGVALKVKSALKSGYEIAGGGQPLTCHSLIQKQDEEESEPG